MVKASEFETSKYLSAKTAGEYNGKTLTIYNVKPELVREVRKLVCEFENVEKTLPLNKTNRNALADAYGDDTDAWLGKVVVLHITRVMYEGNLTPSVVLETKPEVQTDITVEHAKKAKK